MASKKLLSTLFNRSTTTYLQKRSLNIHEHESIDLLKQYGISTPRGIVAHSVEEAKKFCDELSSEEIVIKAQVLAGGRGLGHFDNGFRGGVHMCDGKDEVARIAEQMLGHNLITKQTGEEGRPCEKVFLCERRFPRKEYYVSIAMDRGLGDATSRFGPVLVASREGGTSIEDVAAATPELVIRTPISMEEGLTRETAMKVAEQVGFSSRSIDAAADFYVNLYKLFIDKDCTQVEINPMTVDQDWSVMAMDAKINFDDNADYKHQDIFSLKDDSQDDPRIAQAAESNLNYIPLDGKVGCLVNGAGLALATCDIIKLHGGSPANFLDVGGGATSEQVTDAFKLIISDPNVNAILVNIFGGIMRCDVIAEGVVNAARSLDIQVPIVVRLRGTKVEEAKVIIAQSGMKIHSEDNFNSAAQLVSTMSRIADEAKAAGIPISFPERSEEEGAEAKGKYTLEL